MLAPAVAIGIAARVIEALLPSAAEGAFAVALVPAPLWAADVVTRLRGRMDLAGALAIGTIVFSLLFIGSRSALAAGGLFAATESFAIAAMVANAIPMLRDAILLPLRLAGWLAAAVVICLAVVGAPLIDAPSIIAALALLVAGVGTAAVAARLTGREITAVAAGAGVRDPILATAFASLALGPQSSGVAMVYGVFCLVLAAVAMRTR